jgi:hypothetical protein
VRCCVALSRSRSRSASCLSGPCVSAAFAMPGPFGLAVRPRPTTRLAGGVSLPVGGDPVSFIFLSVPLQNTQKFGNYAFFDEDKLSHETAESWDVCAARVRTTLRALHHSPKTCRARRPYYAARITPLGRRWLQSLHILLAFLCSCCTCIARPPTNTKRPYYAARITPLGRRWLQSLHTLLAFLCSCCTCIAQPPTNTKCSPYRAATDIPAPPLRRRCAAAAPYHTTACPLTNLI